MKTCTKFRVTKAKNGFYATDAHCKPCKSSQRKEGVRTSKGRLRASYDACKRRHFFKLKRESKMMAFARFKAIYDAQGGRCVESGAPFVFDSKDLFPSADRIDNNGGNKDGNIRFVTWRVNRWRGSKTIEEFRGSSQDRPSVVLPDYIFTDRK
jgi:hypothetical protein